VPKGMVLIVVSTTLGKTIPCKETLFFNPVFEALLFPRVMRKDSPQEWTHCLHSKVGMGER